MNQDLKTMAFVLVGLSLTFGCSRREASVETSGTGYTSKPAAAQQAQTQKPEQKSDETNSVEPQVQSEIENMEAQKRADLLKDAQSALEETRNALAALDRNDKSAALAALERASGKLDLVVARDPHLALAPVGVTTTVIDLYATPDTVKRVIGDAKDDLSRNQVQETTCIGE